MTSIETIQKWKEKNPQIENIVVFVSDSLRYDYLPRSIANMGITFKTVASSTYTASSFPSIITGLYPHHHCVFTFFDKLPSGLPSLLNIPGYHTSLWMENTWVDLDPPGQSQLHRLLNHKKAIPLDELNPPFIYLEDEKGGHCPYGWTMEDIYKETECRRFFKDYGKKSDTELIERYRLGLDRSVHEFEKRLQVLKRRQLLDTTLVLFISDHGELLGEYGGLIGHGFPTAPQIAYVPTVFLHPDLPKGINFEHEGVLRHVDLFPTIQDILNLPKRKVTDGVSLLASEKLPKVGISYWKTELHSSLVTYHLKEKGIWDTTGGYLFREGSHFFIQLAYGIYDTTVSNSLHALYLRGQLRTKKLKMLTNYAKIIRNMCFSPIRYGSPRFDIRKAQRLSETLTETKFVEPEKEKIKKTIDRLKKEGKI